MALNLFIQPPEIVQLDTDRVIFLAGPIQGAPDWQSEAAKTIHSIDSSIVVASPRKAYKPDEFVYEKQVDWETHFLRLSGKNGVVIFWLPKQIAETPGRSYAQTTRFELAEWKMRHEHDGSRIIIGIQDGFGNERYIRRRFGQDDPDVVITDSLEDLCRRAVELLTFDK